MLVSFRQTYSSGRDELFDIYLRDKRLIELTNLCDINIYSFHNCDRTTIDSFQQKIKGVIKNPVYLEFQDISYTETVKGLKIYLKEIGCTHFFFHQDDTFSIIENENVDWNELLAYIKSYDKDFMLSLYNKHTILNPRDPDVINKSFDVYESTTWDFYKSDKTPWPMDDTPYICTVDMLDEMYDEEYFSTVDIWEAERLLRDRYKKKKRSINRFVTNKAMFRNYNLFGKTLFMADIARKILRRNKLVI